MNFSGNYGYKEISHIIKLVSGYGEDNIAEHLADIESRFEAVTQTVRPHQGSVEAIKLNKIQVQLKDLKSNYETFNVFTTPDEVKMNMMRQVDQINRLLEKFEEGSEGDYNEN
jgi:cupin superfamily acireductone dioxygenase involved in methionine salvage